MPKKPKTLNLRVPSKTAFIVVVILILLSFILMFDRVAILVAGFLENDPTKQDALGQKIADTSGNIFTGGVSVMLIWLAIAVVAAPVAAMAIGFLGIAFAAFTVFNVIKNQGPNDVLR